MGNTFQVTNLDESGTGSLRQAILDANADPSATPGDPHVIAFHPSLAGGTITLADAALGDIGITNHMVIDGDLNGDERADIILDGGGNSRIFDIGDGDGDTVILDSLTLRNGGVADRGGAVQVEASTTLTLSRSTIADSSAGIGGGGLFNYGTTTILGSAILGNSVSATDATIGGGGLANTGGATMTVANTTVAGNSATSDLGAYGGGIDSYGGTLTLEHVTLTGNTRSSQSGMGYGAGLASNGPLTIANSLILGNAADGVAEDIGTGSSGSASYRGANIIGDALFRGDAVDAGGIAVGDVFADLDGSGGAAADNGGPVQTVLLKRATTNPAIDRADDSGLSALEAPFADARGIARGVDFPDVDNGAGNTFDLGAVELLTGPAAGGDVPASLVVTTLIDEGPLLDGTLADLQGGAGLSLREAIHLANIDPTTHETITFGAGLDGRIVRLTRGELEITGKVTIDGDVLGDTTHAGGLSAFDDIVIDAGGTSRVINISDAGADTTLNGLTITGGATTGNWSDQTAHMAAGGGVRSLADLTVTNSTVAGNATDGIGARGGGIFANASLSLTNSVVSGNGTSGGLSSGGLSKGGGIYGAADVTLTNSTVIANETTAEDSQGGGIHGVATVTLTNSTVTGNSIEGRFGEGGGIHGLATVTLTNSTVSGNSTSGEFSRGGGIYGQAVTLTSSTVSGNSTSGEFSGGGGIYGQAVTLANSIVLGNVTTHSGLGGDEIRGNSGGLTFEGSNIVGADAAAFDTTGLSNVSNADPAEVFIATAEVFDAGGSSTGVFAGVLGDNGGLVRTAQTRLEGPAGRAGDPSLLPDDTQDLDGDDDIGEPLPLDANGNPRVSGGLDLGAVEAFEAASLIVTTPDDVVNALDGVTSLREALAFANADADASAITFDSSLAGATLVLTQGRLAVTTDVEIDGDTTGDDVPDIAISGGGAQGIFEVIGSGTDFVLRSLILEDADESTAFAGDGRAVSADAGTYVSVSSSILRNNQGAGYGGALYSSGSVAITDTTFAGNSSTNAGGAVRVGGDGTFLAIESSTFVGNNSVYGDAVEVRAGTATIVNSTFTGNGTFAHAINNFEADLSIFNSTISGNAGGISSFGNFTNTTTLHSTVVAGNAMFGEARDVFVAPAGGEPSGVFDGPASIVSGGSNLIGAVPSGAETIFTDGVNGDRAGTVSAPLDPMLGALADNGGPVQTMLPLAGSPLIDAGANPIGRASDARGAPREVDLADGGDADIGAAELQGLPLTGPQTLVVTTLDDELDSPFADASIASMGGAGDLSLREALFLANRDADTADTITFAAGLGALDGDPDNNPEIRLEGAEEGDLGYFEGEALSIEGKVTIDGDTNDDGIPDITLYGFMAPSSFTGRILEVASGVEDVVLNGLVLTNGIAPGLQGGGGAILINEGADVRVEDSILTLNGTDGFASERGGAIAVYGGDTGSRLEIVKTSLLANFSKEDGGGIFAERNVDLVIQGSTISDNRALGDGKGGGIDVFGGSLSIANSIVSGNDAIGDGGGISFSGGRLAITDSTVSGNTSSTDGGGVGISSTTSASILRATISDNRASNDGGGIYSHDGGVTVANSTISGNYAGHIGGGVYLDSSLDNPNTIVQSTITDNEAAGDGGGILNYDGLLIVRASTIARNTAGEVGGGVASYGDSATRTQLVSTVVAGNTAADGGQDVSTFDDDENDFFEAGFLSTNNLIGTGQDDDGSELFTDGENGNIVGSDADRIDPMLGPLQDNGGPVHTMLPMPGSPLIGAGSALVLPADDLDLDGDGNIAEPLPIDARELPRVVGLLDIGAVERRFAGPAEITVTLGQAPSGFVGNKFAGRSQPDGIIGISLPDASGGSGPVVVAFDAFDIDFENEVEIRINGAPLGFAPLTADNGFGPARFAFDLEPDGENLLTVQQVLNPAFRWGIDKFRIFEPDLDLEIGGAPSGSFGNRFEGKLDSDGIVTATVSSSQISSTTAVVLFDAFDVDFADEIAVRYNGALLDFVPGIGNNAFVPGRMALPNSPTPLDLSVLSFEQNLNANFIWGVKNIRLVEADMQLAIGTAPSGQFGNRFAGRSDADGIVTATFAGTGELLILVLDGFDIDFADEVAVRLNGESLGFLDVSPNDGVEETRIFISADAQSAGQNVLSFEQNRDPGFIWGVDNVRIVQPDFLLEPGDAPLGQPFGDGLFGRSDADGEINALFQGTGDELVLALRGFDVDTPEEVRVRLNGETLGFLDVSPNEDFSGSRIFIPAGDQRAGDNLLTFEQTGSPGEVWGFADVRLLQPEAELAVGGAPTGAFGNRFGGLSQPDGIVATTFEGAGESLVAILDGFDIDFADEVVVRLNGEAIGFLPVSEDNGRQAARIALPEELQNAGRNVLGFEQNLDTGFIWGVDDIRLVAPDLELDIGSAPSGPFGNRFAGRSDADGIVTATFEATSGPLIAVLDGYDIDFADEVVVRLNGEAIGFLPVGPDNGVEKTRIVIAEEAQKPGQNVLSFEQTRDVGFIWGVDNVQLVRPDATLELGGAPAGPFGNRFGALTDPGGVVAAIFENTGGAMTLGLDGFDVDFADEVAVRLNGELLGFLDKTPNNGIGPSQFEISEAQQLEGQNVLTFEQNRDVAFAWGVDDIVFSI